jgi:membrane protein
MLNTHLHDLTPEARRKQIARLDGDMAEKLRAHLGYRSFTVIQRVVTGVWRDRFIHAGNLAYMAILAIFPLFHCGGGLFSLVETSERVYLVHAFLRVMPIVSGVLEPVARDVWKCAMAGCCGRAWRRIVDGVSLIETVRDILRRAYGTPVARKTFWRRRLIGTGLVMVAVILLVSLYMQVAISTTLQLIPIGTIANRPWPPISACRVWCRWACCLARFIFIFSS